MEANTLLQMIRPLPKAVSAERKIRRGQGKRFPLELTSSPEKERLRFLPKCQRTRSVAEPLDEELRDMVDMDISPDVELDLKDQEEEQQALKVDPRKEQWTPAETKAGNWLLVCVKGGRRQSTCFRYVVQAMETYDEEDVDWIKVQGFRSINEGRTRFQVSYIEATSTTYDSIADFYLFRRLKSATSLRLGGTKCSAAFKTRGLYFLGELLCTNSVDKLTFVNCKT